MSTDAPIGTPAARRATLAQVEAKARADLKAAHPGAVVDWAFRHARAVARLAEAELAYKAFDADRFRLVLDLGTKSLTDPGAVEALTFATQSLHSAAADLGEAKAIEVACAHVLRLLERQTARQATPAAKGRAA